MRMNIGYLEPLVSHENSCRFGHVMGLDSAFHWYDRT